MSKVYEIVTSGTLRPGVWSQEEDDLLLFLIEDNTRKWGEISNILNSKIHKGLRIRTGKQCKERWNNHLNPLINREPWTPNEDLELLEAFKRHGNRWSKISMHIINRTESSIKNRIKSLLNKEK